MLTYDLVYGGAKVGVGTLEEGACDTVRAKIVTRSRLRIRGGIPLFRVRTSLESWFDPTTYVTRRFVQESDIGSHDRTRRYEIDADRRVYLEKAEAVERPTVEDPLDDLSFLYYVRSMSLPVGATYEFARYFRPDRNPVKLRVLRRERVTVPAGTYDAIVVAPEINTRGIFAQGGSAEMWLAEDPSRTLLQVKTRLKLGTLVLRLKHIAPAG